MIDGFLYLYLIIFLGEDVRLSSSAVLAVRILDLNDNPPELRNGGTAFIPDDVSKGQFHFYSVSIIVSIFDH